MLEIQRIVSFFSGESNLQHYPVFLYEDFPYDFSYIKLPQCHTGYVYFFVSLTNSRKIYIGETFDIITRLKQHNSDNGTTFTNENRPWALYSYIIGFNRNKYQMKSVENSWQHLQNIAVNNGIRNPKDRVRSGLPLVLNSNGK